MALPFYAYIVMGCVGIITAITVAMNQRSLTYETRERRARGNTSTTSSNTRRHDERDKCLVCSKELMATVHRFPCGHSVHIPCNERMNEAGVYGCSLCDD